MLKRAVNTGNQRGLIRQIGHTDRATADFVFITRANAPPRRPDLCAFARGFLAGAVKFPVNRQDQRCVFRNHQCLRADLNALCAHSLDLIHQMPRVKHNTIADHAQLTAAHHTRRQRMQLVNFAINNKRMARIVPALKARNHIRALGKPVHNLAFALVAPLCADNHYICHTGPLRFCVEFSVKPALVYRAASRGETPNSRKPVQGRGSKTSDQRHALCALGVWKGAIEPNVALPHHLMHGGIELLDLLVGLPRIAKRLIKLGHIPDFDLKQKIS